MAKRLVLNKKGKEEGKRDKQEGKKNITDKNMVGGNEKAPQAKAQEASSSNVTRRGAAHNTENNLSSREMIARLEEFCKTIVKQHGNPWYKNKKPSEYINKHRNNYDIKRFSMQQRALIDFLHKKFFSYGKPCFLRQTLISEKMGVSNEVINRQITWFENKGLLIRISRVTPNKNIQTFLLPSTPEVSNYFVKSTLKLHHSKKALKNQQNENQYVNPFNYYKIKREGIECLNTHSYTQNYMDIFYTVFGYIIKDIKKIMIQPIIIPTIKKVKPMLPKKKSVEKTKTTTTKIISTKKPERIILKRAGSFGLKGEYKFKPEELVKGWDEGNKNFSPMLTKVKDMLFYLDQQNKIIDYELTNKIIGVQDKIKKKFDLKELESIKINDSKKYHQFAVVVNYLYHKHFNQKEYPYEIVIKRFASALKNSSKFSFMYKWNLITFFTDPKERGYLKHYLLSDEANYVINEFMGNRKDEKRLDAQIRWKNIYINTCFNDKEEGKRYYLAASRKLMDFLEMKIREIEKNNLDLCGMRLVYKTGGVDEEGERFIENNPPILKAYLEYLQTGMSFVKVDDICCSINWDNFVMDEMRYNQDKQSFWKKKYKDKN